MLLLQEKNKEREMAAKKKQQQQQEQLASKFATLNKSHELKLDRIKAELFKLIENADFDNDVRKKIQIVSSEIELKKSKIVQANNIERISLNETSLANIESEYKQMLTTCEKQQVE